MKSISRPAVGSVDVLMFIFSFGQHEKTSTHNNSTALLVIGTWLEPTQTVWPWGSRHWFPHFVGVSKSLGRQCVHRNVVSNEVVQKFKNVLDFYPPGHIQPMWSRPPARRIHGLISAACSWQLATSSWPMWQSQNTPSGSGACVSGTSDTWLLVEFSGFVLLWCCLEYIQGEAPQL